MYCLVSLLPLLIFPLIDLFDSDGNEGTSFFSMIMTSILLLTQFLNQNHHINNREPCIYCLLLLAATSYSMIYGISSYIQQRHCLDMASSFGQRWSKFLAQSSKECLHQAAHQSMA